MFNYLFAAVIIALGWPQPTGHLQEKTTYKHPHRNFTFSAEDSWIENTCHSDTMIYEMVSREKAVRVILWYNGGTEMSCPRYLIKMADFKELDFGEPVEYSLDGKEFWVLETEGTDNGVPVHNTIVAMSYREKYGEDAPERCRGREYNAMHIAQIICPMEKYDRNKAVIREITESLELYP